MKRIVKMITGIMLGFLAATVLFMTAGGVLIALGGGCYIYNKNKAQLEEGDNG